MSNTSDEDVLSRISALVDEEHAIEGEPSADPPGEDRQRRLREIEVALDQCWDLLRQRRARRAAGNDPDDAAPRSESTVEHYQQ